MILWLLLFLLVIGISFILAFRSMKDYQEIPKETNLDYGLFLIRQIKNFDVKLLDSIRQEILTQEGMVSLERLFKGRETALTIFGPKNILLKFQSGLDILELEDYTTEFTDNRVCVWQVGVREAVKLNLPQLEAEEQFVWQVIIGKNQIQIRAAVSSGDPVRKKRLTSLLQNLNAGGLVKIPKPYSNEQMLDFFKSRSLSKDSKGLILSSEEIMRLLTI